MRTSFFLALVVLGSLTANAQDNSPQAERESSKKPLPTDSDGTYREEREFCGPIVNTPELHEIRFPQPDPTGAFTYQGRPCYRIGDGKYCFQETRLVVTTGSPLWYFVSAPRVACARNNQGSCGWNQLGKPDRTVTTAYNASRIDVSIWTNSRNIGVQICATARRYERAKYSDE